MDIQNKTLPPPTLGESRVRTKFNVSEDKAQRSNVDVLKQESASLIDFCESGKQAALANEEKNQSWKSESARLWSLAQTAYEEAAMWAVKAATA
mgnify:CR=1 FL=1